MNKRKHKKQVKKKALLFQSVIEKSLISDLWGEIFPNDKTNQTYTIKWGDKQ